MTGYTTDTTTQVTALAPTAAVNNTAGVLVTVNDSGNYYVKPQVAATLMDGSKIIATGSVDTGWPIIPGYSRQYQVNFTGSGAIPAGKYQVAVNVKDGTGNLLTQGTYPVQFTTQQVLQTTDHHVWCRVRANHRHRRSKIWQLHQLDDYCRDCCHRRDNYCFGGTTAAKTKDVINAV